MPVEYGAKYIRKRQRSPKSCAPGSFRTIKRGKNRIVICCPRGHWNRKRQRCRVGTRAQSILKAR